MKPTAIFIVFGNEVSRDFSNTKSIVTRVIPNIGEGIVFQKKHYIVKDKTINYSSVEDYDALDAEGRGKETIWIFI